MKKKRTPPAVPAEAVEALAEVASTPRKSRSGRHGERCAVCGNPVAPFSDESLCWVCRRLKISAWRDSDNQAAAQE
jgi:ribosomal protein S14